MKKLYRSRYDRMFLGVLGGSAQYFESDPTVLRIFAAILWVFTGFIPILIVYLIAAIIIPLEPKGASRKEYSRFFRSKKNRKIAGICGGIAERLKCDATLVRLVAVFLCVITGIVPIFLAYIIGWFLIPEKP